MPWSMEQVYNKRHSRGVKRTSIRSQGDGTEAVRGRSEESAEDVAAVAHVLGELDGARIRAGLSKASLAQRAELPETSVRKLFSSSTANPALKTLSRLASALGLRVTLSERASAAALPSLPDTAYVSRANSKKR